MGGPQDTMSTYAPLAHHPAFAQYAQPQAPPMQQQPQPQPQQHQLPQHQAMFMPNMHPQFQPLMALATAANMAPQLAPPFGHPAPMAKAAPTPQDDAAHGSHALMQHLCHAVNTSSQMSHSDSDDASSSSKQQHHHLHQQQQHQQQQRQSPHEATVASFPATTTTAAPPVGSWFMPQAPFYFPVSQAMPAACWAPTMMPSTTFVSMAQHQFQQQQMQQQQQQQQQQQPQQQPVTAPLSG
ncbi:hypothetical protein PTSG_13183 [Salpingoeca rosetta]|uniref:Uncharacterized protein n=1 Tax=Salpingoeca rosetta (strain ATCC 50818 / BSB-021) TaxID=946362 RepID=F2UT86_SALR5|nr:uncharacterized protein PTSG_13183 [Salpingoeca rosetta]EGD81345.1 hypothetical protein PTSG_13183 [Salpingoeca rosetta]|eukprot:XP_004987622.1 hypothetical protein PTSG_13183 [Salpingoeca rosetta]